MQAMIIISLVINIIVLIPVCWSLMTNASWTLQAYGDVTQARNILLSVYVAIGLISTLLLMLRDPKLVAALLLVQVVYKLLSPIAVGSLDNPVIISNLLIGVVHSVTLFFIWRSL